MRKYEPRLATVGRVLLRVPAELVRAQLRLVVAVRAYALGNLGSISCDPGQSRGFGPGA